MVDGWRVFAVLGCAFVSSVAWLCGFLGFGICCVL